MHLAVQIVFISQLSKLGFMLMTYILAASESPRMTRRW